MASGRSASVSESVSDSASASASREAEASTQAASEARPRAKALRDPAIWIATAGGFGYAPIAPGTFGSAVGLVLFFGISGMSLPLYVLTVATLSVLGIWASDRAEVVFGRKDDGRIVIDEVAGQLITLLPVLVLAASPLAGPLGFSVGDRDWILLVVTGFVAFRVFDVWKPGPVRWAERNFRGGLGVVADDLVAGAIGAVAMTVPCYALLLARLSISGQLVSGQLVSWQVVSGQPG